VAGLGLAAALSAALVAGCGGGDDDSDATPPEDTATTTDDGLTRPGTDVEFGRPATVELAPDPQHRSRVEVSVTGFTRGAMKDLKQFKIPERAQQSHVYYVQARVENVGDGNLAGTSLVLYGKVSDELVVPPVTFGSTFKRCNYQPFDKPFRSGAKAKVCMVMLAPDKGTISEVQWRGPDEEPISWPVS
jgi:hypothetical protein